MSESRPDKSRPDKPTLVSAVERDIDTLLADFQLAETEQDLPRLHVIDERLRELLASNQVQNRAREGVEVRAILIEKLQRIDAIHRALLHCAVEQRSAVADTLQQLRHDQRAAHAYEHVRRQSL